MNLIFLDRDGVINELVERDGGRYSPLSYETFRLIKGVKTAIIQLTEHNFRVVVVTNQPEIQSGRLVTSELENMHADLLAIGIEEVLFCPHQATDGCSCRKPSTGLMTDFLRRTASTPERLWMIGDRNSDLMAGKQIGANTIWISTGQQVAGPPKGLADFEALSLEDATKIVLSDNNSPTLRS